ncbi:hypothetical protein [Prosthecomicrobium pneumaticum]|uniref:Uncharacterized protein n=1 Tax=Prosthecomicrobium pneumaticum TaxID=81895 RepID=A0A7W9CSQ6_9HYPH|nr:hypothetical protein [Prosthecomicrobium pneumaticum]MBB5751102.1 hypothetical protein [Prosthecomicrobium pneumaticum]
MKTELLKVSALAALLVAGSVPAFAQSNPPAGANTECAPGTTGTIVPNADGTTSCVQSNANDNNSATGTDAPGTGGTDGSGSGSQ